MSAVTGISINCPRCQRRALAPPGTAGATVWAQSAAGCGASQGTVLLVSWPSEAAMEDDLDAVGTIHEVPMLELVPILCDDL